MRFQIDLKQYALKACNQIDNHMKTRSYLWMSAAAVLFTASCTKDEPASVPASLDDLKKYQLSVPLADGRKVIETRGESSSKLMNASQPSSSSWFSQIQVPDENYVKSTTLMSLEKPANFSKVGCIGDQKLKLTFIDSLLKMPGYPEGWTALWNRKPFVENDSPTVLYTQQRNRLTINLSRYVTTFGFELAPNLYNTFDFSVGFYDSKENPPVASLEQSATTPLGARLFAVQSKRPFNVIEISFSGNEDTDNHPWGFAIANIRYCLKH